MLILPAIDVRDGKCVRLRQGDFNQETVFGNDPAAMAQRWVAAGAKALHLVDLDGARAGRPMNEVAVQSIVKAVSVPCQLGGGIRTDEDIERVLGWGVQRVIIGTRALLDPGWIREMAFTYPKQIILGLDARDGKVASHGWMQTSEATVVELARQFTNWPLAAIVYTDIGRDGMLSGPNIAALVELANAVPIPVIASGGVSTPADVQQLAEKKLAGCIIGRALYEGTIDLAQLLKVLSPGSFF